MGLSPGRAVLEMQDVDGFRVETIRRRNVSPRQGQCWPQLVFSGNVSKAALWEITSFTTNLGKSSFCFSSKNLENQTQQKTTCDRRQGTCGVQGSWLHRRLGPGSLTRLRSRCCLSGYSDDDSVRRPTWQSCNNRMTTDVSLSPLTSRQQLATAAALLRAEAGPRGSCPFPLGLTEPAHPAVQAASTESSSVSFVEEAERRKDRNLGKVSGETSSQWRWARCAGDHTPACPLDTGSQLHKKVMVLKASV